MNNLPGTDITDHMARTAEHMTHEQMQGEILVARTAIIDQQIKALDDILGMMERDYYAHDNPTEHQVIVYMSQHNALLRFKHILIEARHAAYTEYISRTGIK